MKLVALRMNLYQEEDAALSFKKFGDPCLKP